MSRRPPAARSGDRTERLSRFLALVLRHRPESVGVALDPSGYVDIDTLAAALARQPGWAWVTADSIRAVARVDPRRYEVSGGRIRARYGHSVPVDTPGPPVVPPEWLYHGTSPAALEAIRARGLQPQARQFVHLSASRQDALAVGQRHSPDAVVITVLARRAHAAGVQFYRASPSIYLARHIPPEFLLLPTPADTPPGG
ncbi:MAG: RNA 2'-phosphotransferase [Armatimonadota bacterium]|nr:RNA 2'-phosphotransferase [Armatimonadota bacterium]MDR7401344.1 RNA 2'-phosphotransferase [Armatimonadota bacterium]MDR7404472.1 RNA 2'-phosphotransferase [Armatimonadota bacterium]MDR7437477.1 RNA 2'-phosphotransferase [Armatimonadota bacterium]MDR7472358.1 RNA 2'-phosphotransferase [Armatimonadota bacterium]